mgnify:CR=1 FL=1
MRNRVRAFRHFNTAYGMQVQNPEHVIGKHNIILGCICLTEGRSGRAGSPPFPAVD